MDNRNVMNNPTPEFLAWARRDTEPQVIHKKIIER